MSYLPDDYLSILIYGRRITLPHAELTALSIRVIAQVNCAGPIHKRTFARINRKAHPGFVPGRPPNLGFKGQL